MTSAAESHIEMFGCSIEDLDAVIVSQTPAPWILPISILSDAQELLSMGELEAARQHMNRAKYIIDKLYGRELFEILSATREALNRLPNNRGIGTTSPRFQSTYDIASALTRHPIAHHLS